MRNGSHPEDGAPKRFVALMVVAGFAVILIGTWLEERFPARHDCHEVVFSPLIGGSHETCRFESNGFSETIMFICGAGEAIPDLYPGILAWAEQM